MVGNDAQNVDDRSLADSPSDDAPDAIEMDASLDAAMDANRDAARMDAVNADRTMTDASRADSAADARACTHGPTSLGPVANYRVGTWTKNATARVIVGHDTAGLFAYTVICTHMGCTIGAPNTRGVCVCPCHLSQYDGNGAVIQGPATLPLVHYAVTICGATAYVDRTMTVPPATRTRVP
jgi:nitrite reductase/ring-hydroxylating ferredoxin subunit